MFTEGENFFYMLQVERIYREQMILRRAFDGSPVYKRGGMICSPQECSDQGVKISEEDAFRYGEIHKCEYFGMLARSKALGADFESLGHEWHVAEECARCLEWGEIRREYRRIFMDKRFYTSGQRKAAKRMGLV